MPNDNHSWMTLLLNSEFVQGVIAFFVTLLTAGVGVMAKIADEVKSGSRRKFVSKRLWLDVPALIMMTLVVIAIATYYELPGPIAAGLGPVFGYVGPQVVDALLAHKLRK